MKVLFLLPSLLSKGPVNQCVSLIQGLIESSNSVRISLLVLGGNFSENNLKRVNRLGVDVEFIEGNLYQQLGTLINKVRLYRPDIVHSHCLKADLFVSLLRVRYKEFVSFSTVHCYIDQDYIFTYGKYYGFLLSKLHSFVLKRIDAPVSCSRSVGKNNRIRLGIVSDYVRNGTGSPLMPRRTNNNGLVKYIYVGPIIARKNVENVIASFLETNHDNASLTIIGDGPLLMQLKETYSGCQSIAFKGNMNHDDVINELVNADVFVSASYAEGLPMAVIEAMSCKNALVLSNIEPHNEILDLDKVGWTMGELGQFPIILPDDLEARKSCALELYNTHFTINSMASGYFELYKKRLEY